MKIPSSASVVLAILVGEPTPSSALLSSIPSRSGARVAVGSPRVGPRFGAADEDDDPTSSWSRDRHERPMPPPRVLCVGEALWDSLPSGIFLGGAPANVAVHLASLFRGGVSSSPPSSPPPSSSFDAADADDAPDQQATVAIAASLGNDRLGRETLRRLDLFGVRTDYVQIHEEWETGMATAVLDGMGDATYEFVTPAAWDGLGMDDGLKGLLRAAVAIDDDDDDDPKPSSDDGSRVFFVMGTIASRIHDDDEDASCTVTSSSTICAVRNEAPDGTVVLDVNLRDPWYEPRRVLELARGRRRGDGDGERRRLALLKLNEEELTTLERWLREEEMEGHQPGIDGEMEGEDRGDATPDDASPSSSSLAGGSDLERRMEGLGRRLNALRVCVTRGRDGAALWCGEDARADDGGGGTTAFHEHSGYCHLPPPGGSDDGDGGGGDSVGAGDAFLAAMVYSLLVRGEPPERALERACALGGYVAGRRGATPDHGDAPEGLRRIFSFSAAGG
jgi:fructokinase